MQLRISPSSTSALKGMSVLRSTKGICDTVLHPVLNVREGTPPSKAAGSFAYRHQTRSGMLVKSTLRLRGLFVRNESSLDVTGLAEAMRQCRSALNYYASEDHPSTFRTKPSNITFEMERNVIWARWAASYIGKKHSMVFHTITPKA